MSANITYKTMLFDAYNELCFNCREQSAMNKNNNKLETKQAL